MNFILSTLLFLQARTPHVEVSPTPFDGNDYSAPNIWWGVIGVIAVILIVGLFVGFRNPFKKKEPNPYVHKVEPPK